MNIFFLSLHPNKAARLQCDKHVVKMILETAQLLCTTIHLLAKEEDIPLGLLTRLYRVTHKNHPMAVWVRESQANFVWTLVHGLSLCKEYTKRYKREHKTEAVLRAIRTWYKACRMTFPFTQRTRRPMCMPLEYRIRGPSIQKDVVKSYWLYYANEKKNFAKWAHGPTPAQWEKMVQ